MVSEAPARPGRQTVIYRSNSGPSVFDELIQTSPTVVGDKASGLQEAQQLLRDHVPISRPGPEEEKLLRDGLTTARRPQDEWLGSHCEVAFLRSLRIGLLRSWLVGAAGKELRWSGMMLRRSGAERGLGVLRDR